jgi:hypothetical protein
MLTILIFSIYRMINGRYFHKLWRIIGKEGKSESGKGDRKHSMYRVKEIAELLSEFSVETEKVDDFLEAANTM